MEAGVEKVEAVTIKLRLKNQLIATNATGSYPTEKPGLLKVGLFM